MNPALKSITLSNFRSIKGSVTIPLEAPVVLIYGQNGAGKTSILSALELALTGQVPSLRRYDADYAAYLVHKGTDKAQVEVLAEGLGERTGSGQFTLSQAGMSGSPLLSSERAQFYSERCFLAQATLGRLLEIYESKDTHSSDSPLTRFVKDLLGLDHLDALIEGLHDAGDVRRFRVGVPKYWEVRDRVPALEEEIRSDVDELTKVNASVDSVESLLRQRLEPLGHQFVASEAANLINLLRDNSEEDELQRLARLRRDITATRDQWSSIQVTVAADARQRSEHEHVMAQTAFDDWKSRTGRELDVLFGKVQMFFPDVQPHWTRDPGKACAMALQVVELEAKRGAKTLADHAASAQQLSELDQSRQRVSARIAALDLQIQSGGSEASNLAQALAALLPHIHSDDCPVCGRDFSEKSSGTLQAHLSRRIASLTEAAGRLEALTRERSECSRALAETDRQHAGILALQFPSAMLDELKMRRAALDELRRSLVDIAPAADIGTQLITRLATASTALTEIQARDQIALAIRESSNQFAKLLDLPPLGEAEGVEEALNRYYQNVVEGEETLSSRQVSRRSALSDLTERQSLVVKRHNLENGVQRKKDLVRALVAAQNSADDQIMQARELAKRAKEVRVRIVRRVFNESLNTVWQDLFVRLAPDEPFVPAFAVPDSEDGAVEAVLETVYRAGGKGGNPRAMLSAGNLNTAALTLYLALHLSVSPTLPWLVIDDPVQSMDEVHVAQFAALLRTLSKQHKRQVIIAVHERPLFDYLALELSPAFKNDRLATIEIGRTSSGATVVNYDLKTWDPDTAVAA